MILKGSEYINTMSGLQFRNNRNVKATFIFCSFVKLLLTNIVTAASSQNIKIFATNFNQFTHFKVGVIDL